MLLSTDQDCLALLAMTSRNDDIHSSGPAAINIVDVLRGVGRRKLLVLVMGLTAFGLAYGLVRGLKPVYTTEAQVLIQNLETPYDQVQPPANQRNNAVDDRIVASQMSVLKSEDLGRRVVAALDLEKKAEFNALIKGIDRVGRIKIALGFGTDPRRQTPDQRALSHYIDELDVFQLPGSNVIGIKYSSHDPELAAQVANTLAEIYVAWTRESQSQPTERAREWLSTQINALRDRLSTSEQAVEKFRAEAGLLQGTSSTLGTQEISELNSQITVAKSASLEARAKANAIRDLLAAKGSVDTATDVLASSAIQRLKEQRTDASRRFAELSVTYLSNHPKIIAVRNELDNIDKQLRAEALKVVASLDEQARIAEARVNSLEANLSALKSKEETSNLNDVKLKALEREAAADRALLETMLSRYAEANARQEMTAQPGLGLVIQSAGVPSSPSFPKSGPMVALITIAGLSFGMGLAFLMELMAAASRLPVPGHETKPRHEPGLEAVATRTSFVESRPVAARPPVMRPSEAPKVVRAAEISGAADATKASEAAPAGEVPEVATSDDAPEAAPAEKSSAHPEAPPAKEWIPAPSEALRSVQARPVLNALQHLTVWPKITPHGDMSGVTDLSDIAKSVQDMTDWASEVRLDFDVKRIALTSLGGGDADAPVAAVALARALSRSGTRVIVLDLAGAGSILGGLCGVAQGPGLSNLVSGTAPVTKVIARDCRSAVHVLRYGTDDSQRTAELVPQRIGTVLNALANNYDLSIINLGETGKDTPDYLHKCEAALIMAPASRLTEAATAVQALMTTGMASAQHVLIGNPASWPAAEATGSMPAVNG